MAAINPLTSVLQGGYHHPLTRSLQAERSLTKDMLMYPIFITDDPQAEVEISSLPGQKRRASLAQTLATELTGNQMGS